MCVLMNVEAGMNGSVPVDICVQVGCEKSPTQRVERVCEVRGGEHVWSY